MAEIITYETLREIQRNEKKGEKLVELKDSFYNSVNKYLNRDCKDDLSATEINNARGILQDITDRRERKILNQALRATRSTERADMKAMTSKERDLFANLVKILSDYRAGGSGEPKKVESIVKEVKKRKKAKPRAKKAGKPEQSKEYIKVKILENLPEIVGSDLKDYGPFTNGDIVSLPRENANIFIEKGKAEALK